MGWLLGYEYPPTVLYCTVPCTGQSSNARCIGSCIYYIFISSNSHMHHTSIAGGSLSGPMMAHDGAPWYAVCSSVCTSTCRECRGTKNLEPYIKADRAGGPLCLNVPQFGGARLGNFCMISIVCIHIYMGRYIYIIPNYLPDIGQGGNGHTIYLFSYPLCPYSHCITALDRPYPNVISSSSWPFRLRTPLFSLSVIIDRLSLP